MRIKYIDVLKAIAIFSVVLYHTGLMQYGYLGVDLFLVINGYLITRGLSNKVLNISYLNGGGIFASRWAELFGYCPHYWLLVYFVWFWASL